MNTFYRMSLLAIVCAFFVSCTGGLAPMEMPPIDNAEELVLGPTSDPHPDEVELGETVVEPEEQEIIENTEIANAEDPTVIETDPDVVEEKPDNPESGIPHLSTAPPQSVYENVESTKDNTAAATEGETQQVLNLLPGGDSKTTTPPTGFATQQILNMQGDSGKSSDSTGEAATTSMRSSRLSIGTSADACDMLLRAFGALEVKEALFNQSAADNVRLFMQYRFFLNYGTFQALGDKAGVFQVAFKDIWQPEIQMFDEKCAGEDTCQAGDIATRLVELSVLGFYAAPTEEDAYAIAALDSEKIINACKGVSIEFYPIK